MNEKIKYLLTVSCLVIFPLLWKFQQPLTRFIGLGLLVILSLIWLVQRARKIDHFRIPKFLPFILLFLILQVILITISPNKTNGFYLIVYRIIILIFFIFIADQINNPTKRRFWENVIIGAGVVYAGVDLIYVLSWYSNWWAINNGLFPLPSLLLRSPGIFLGHPNFQSGYLTLVTPFALVRLLSAERRSARVFWSEIMLILLLANFLTHSRGGWLALGGAVFVTLFLFYKPKLNIRAITISKFLPDNLSKIWYLGFGIISLAIIGAGVLFVQLLGSFPHGTIGGRLDIYSFALQNIEKSPVWGNGTGSVPAIFALRGYAIGGDETYHAHNTWLQVALESGILGIILIIIALGFILWGFRSSWLKLRDEPITRYSLAAYAGAGTAFLIHSLFDWLLWEAAYALAVAIILGLISSLTTNKHIFIIKKRYGIALLSLLLLISSIGFVYLNRGTILYWEGRSAAAKWDWYSARSKLCQAADLSPNNALYFSQCSLANAYLAKLNQDPDALIKAKEYQDRVIELDPNWYIHWANLSSYEWQLGDYDAAISHMQKAVDMAPNHTFLLVGLAWMLEVSGNTAQAFEYYHAVYCRNPGYQKTILFHESAIFPEVAKEECPGGFSGQPGESFTDILRAGHQSLKAGNYTEAKHHYLRAIPANIQSGAPYAYLALVSYLSGDFQQSDKELQTAFHIEKDTVTNHEIAARIAFEKGNLSQGYEHLFESVLIRQNTSLSRKYYSYAYHEMGLPSDLSPYFPRTLGVEQLKLFKQLAAYLSEEGDLKKYQQVVQWLEIMNTP